MRQTIFHKPHGEHRVFSVMFLSLAPEKKSQHEPFQLGWDPSLSRGHSFIVLRFSQSFTYDLVQGMQTSDSIVHNPLVDQYQNVLLQDYDFASTYHCTCDLLFSIYGFGSFMSGICCRTCCFSPSKDTGKPARLVDIPFNEILGMELLSHDFLEILQVLEWLSIDHYRPKL